MIARLQSHGKRSVPIVPAVQSLRSVQAVTVAARRIWSTRLNVPGLRDEHVTRTRPSLSPNDPEQLAASYLSLSAFRQCSKEPDNRKSIVFCSDLEIAVDHGCWISSFILQPLSFQVRLCRADRLNLLIFTYTIGCPFSACPFAPS
jgi:hypothetical protein